MRIVIVLLATAALIGGALLLRDPYRTRLPFGTTDLSSVQEQLARLPQADRDLVEAYVERSGGDVLPPAMADPDVPLTARTFGEAIELQNRYLTYAAGIETKMRERQAQRQSRLAPLRAALSVRLEDRRILPRSEAAGLPPPKSARGGESPFVEAQVAVTTFSLSNRSEETITAAEGSVTVRKAGIKPKGGSPEGERLSGCHITHNTPIPPGGEVPVRCADLGRQATLADREYVALSHKNLSVAWEPRMIRFADGRELRFQD